MKRYLVILALFGLCLWSLWLRQQTFSTIALLLCVAAIYQSHTKRLVAIVERLLFSARTAKFGDIEVQLEQGLERILGQLTAKSAWVHLAMSKLDIEAITLLLGIARTDVYQVRNALKPALRRLRDYGLIEHNHETLESSTTVKVTDLGRELAESLASAKLPTEIMSPNEADPTKE